MDAYSIQERISIIMEGSNKTEAEAKSIVKMAWLEKIEPELCQECKYECTNCPELPEILRRQAE